MATMNELRALARRRTKAAGDKIRRNENKGVFIRGSSVDPTIQAARIGTMSRREMNAYIKRVNKFNDRSQQFVSGDRGAPLPRRLAAEYKRNEDKRNARVTAHAETFMNVFIGPAGMTVAQREATILAENKAIIKAGGTPEWKPYSRRNRRLEGMVDANALAILNRAEAHAARPGSIRTALIKQRKDHVAWARQHGHDELADLAQKMTLRQFDLLKNYTNYTRHVEHSYLQSSGPEGGSGSDKSWAADVIDANILEAKKLSEWALTVK